MTTISAEVVESLRGELVRMLTTDHAFEVLVKDKHNEGYLSDARKIIDEWSTHYNMTGIDRLLGAILTEFLINGYWGKGN